jgi:hypothetical protein
MQDDEIQEIIQRGHEAEDLLRSDAFNSLVEELKDGYFSQWLASKSTDEREKIHASALALEDMVNTLMGRVSEGSTYEHRQNQDNQEFTNDQAFWPDNLMESFENDN